MLNRKLLLFAVVGSTLWFRPVEAAPSDQFFQDRIAKEVTQEGLSLVKLGLRITVHQSDKGAVTLNLIDVATGRILQSRFIESVSDDANAAVAELSMVASALILKHRGPQAQTAVKPTDDDAWTTAMTARAVRTRHHPKSVHVVVLGNAGESGPRAAQALAAAYRASGVAVTGPSVSAHAQISAALEPFRSSVAEHFALLTIQKTPEATTAIVTISKADGSVVTALSFTAGQAPKVESDGVALPSDALGRIGEQREKRSDALKSYAKERVTMMTLGNALGVYAGAAYQGVSQIPLVGDKFYSAIGREDYAQEYRANETKRAIGNWVGFIGYAGGTGLLLGYLTGGTDTIYGAYNETTGRRDATIEGESFGSPMLLNASIATLAVGTVAYLYGLAHFNANPVDGMKRIGLVEEYNAKLREKYGLTEEDTMSIDAGAAVPNRYNLQFSPYVMPTSTGGVGGGVQLRMEF